MPLSTELSPTQAKRAMQEAQELAGAAAQQHKEVLEECRDQLLAVYEGLERPDMMGVTQRRGATTPHAMSHLVALSELDGAGAVLAHHLEIEVKTALKMQPNSMDEISVGYETTAKTVLPDEAVSDEHLTESGMVLTDVLPPRYTGAVIH